MTDFKQNNTNAEDGYDHMLAILSSGLGASIPKDDFLILCKGCSPSQRDILYSMFIKPNMLTVQQQGILLTVAAQERIALAKKNVEERIRLEKLTAEETTIMQAISNGSYWVSDDVESIKMKYKQIPKNLQDIIIASLDTMKNGKALWETRKKQSLFFLAGEDYIIQSITSANVAISTKEMRNNNAIALTQEDLLQGGEKILTASLMELRECSLSILLAGEQLLQVAIMKPRQFASFPFTQNEVTQIAEKLLGMKGMRSDYTPKGFIRGILARSKNAMNFQLPSESNENNNATM
jgi:hypothetical protein